MCIAIYSMKGNDIPCEKYLKTSFEHNDDGAGFAFNTDDNRVRIVKGLMTWDSFKDTFYEYDQKYNFKDRGVLIHFRITTHGGTCPECCHPFPVVSDIGSMHKLEYTADYACIHNGIISLTSFEAHRRDKTSDTMVFVEKYLSKIATNKNWFDNKNNYELIYDMIDSKMAVIDGRGVVHSTYGFTQDEDGNYYSNTTYKEPKVKTFVPYSSGWDYCGYSGYGYYDGDTDSWLSKWKGFRKLAKGESVYFDEGVIEDYNEEDDFDYLIDREGMIFVVFKNDLKKGYSYHRDAEALFCGRGSFINSSTYKELNFKGDLYLLRENVYMDDAVEEVEV